VKVVIRGDKNVGKSTLFARLQNLPLSPTYTTTPEIQVANIMWKYHSTSAVVKVRLFKQTTEKKKKKKRIVTYEDLAPLSAYQ
jgi:GTPase SAR1 family protein